MIGQRPAQSDHHKRREVRAFSAQRHHPIAAAALTEAAIIAGTLNASANTGIVLTSANNQIGAVGVDHTNSGGNHIVQ